MDNLLTDIPVGIIHRPRSRTRKEHYKNSDFNVHPPRKKVFFHIWVKDCNKSCILRAYRGRNKLRGNEEVYDLGKIYRKSHKDDDLTPCV